MSSKYAVIPFLKHFNVLNMPQSGKMGNFGITDFAEKSNKSSIMHTNNIRYQYK